MDTTPTENRKPIKRPAVRYLKQVYADFARQLLAKNPEWWGKYETKLKLKNCYIYAKGPGNKILLKMSWQLWKNAVEEFFHEAKEAIIQGEVLRMGILGRLQAIRVQRNFNKPVINWGLTYKLKMMDENGKLIKVYYTDDDYCRIEWGKNAMIPNERSYCFTPAAKNMETGKGFKKEFINALKEDPLLKFRYKFYPRRSLVDKTDDACNTATAP